MTQNNEKIKDELLAVTSSMRVVSMALENIDSKPCIACDISVVVEENTERLLNLLKMIESE